jgi:hypothetical protein
MAAIGQVERTTNTSRPFDQYGNVVGTDHAPSCPAIANPDVVTPSDGVHQGGYIAVGPLRYNQRQPQNRNAATGTPSPLS